MKLTLRQLKSLIRETITRRPRTLKEIQQLSPEEEDELRRLNTRAGAHEENYGNDFGWYPGKIEEPDTDDGDGEFCKKCGDAEIWCDEGVCGDCCQCGGDCADVELDIKRGIIGIDFGEGTQKKFRITNIDTDLLRELLKNKLKSRVRIYSRDSKGHFEPIDISTGEVFDDGDSRLSEKSIDEFIEFIEQEKKEFRPDLFDLSWISGP